MNYSSLKRRAYYQLAVLPFIGRNIYERLNSRLERQIKIRYEKRKKIKNTKNPILPSQQNENIYDSRVIF